MVPCPLVNDTGFKDKIKQHLRSKPDASLDEILNIVGQSHSRNCVSKTLSNARKELGISATRSGSGPKMPQQVKIPVKTTKTTSHVQTNPKLEELSSPVQALAGRMTSIQIVNNIIDACMANFDINAQYGKTALDAVRERRKWETETTVGPMCDIEYHRPEILKKTGIATTQEAMELLGPHEHWQDALLDCMLENDVALEGTRRCGKSLIDGLASVELLWRQRAKYPQGKICILSGKQEQATRPINTLFENKEVRNAIMPIFDHRTKYTLYLKGGMSIECIPPTDKNTRGGEIVALVTDEAAITKKLAIAQILPAGDTIPEFRWWLSGTPQTEGFFHDAWIHPEEYHIKKIRIKDDMCNWIDKTKRGITADRLKMLAGESFVLQELEGEFVQGDLIFSGQEIEDAFDKAPLPEVFDRVIAGIDIGWGNPTTGILIGFFQRQWFEIDSFSFRGDSDWPLTTTKLFEWGKKHPNLLIYCPTDNGGHSLIKRCRDAKIAIKESDWGTLNKTDNSGRTYENTSKSIPIGQLKELFIGDKKYNEDGDLETGGSYVHLYNRQLETQLYNYKADKKDDDRVDSLLQAVWHSSGINVSVGHG